MRLSSLFLAAAIVGLASGTAMADTMMKASPKPSATHGSMKASHMMSGHAMKADHMKGGSMKSDHKMSSPKPSPHP